MQEIRVIENSILEYLIQHLHPLTKKNRKSSHAIRIDSMWEDFRVKIIEHFPKPKQIRSKKTPLSKVEDIYKLDAYNSLSIEGFDVNQELIEKVRNNHWDPYENLNDREMVNALAARGYYESFQAVERSIAKILDGAHPGITIEEDLSDWYQTLFAPSVRMGILKKTDVLGYRNSPVYIRNSRHIPIAKEGLLDAMKAFFLCLKQEENPVVRAVLGHFIFVYIHPYMDGNGRIARFIMNTMFVTGSYPWTIIHVKNRKEYLSSLESASVDQSIVPFVKFLAKEMEKKSEITQI